MLKFFGNENCVKRCLLPHDQNKSEALRGSSGVGACAVMRTLWYEQEYLL